MRRRRPAHAAEAKQPIEPCAALCVQSAIGSKVLRPRPVGKNALHWAMVEGPQSEQKQLRLLLNPQLAAQPDQGGNLPLHYAASSGVSTACAVACALAFMDGLEWSNKVGRTPVEVARLEGHTGLAEVFSGLLNRRHNELHEAFGGGAPSEGMQLQLLQCRPELAAQKDAQGNLPLHMAARAGASAAAVDECVRIYPDAPRVRNGDGFLPYQLALQYGHGARGGARHPRGQGAPAAPPQPRQPPSAAAAAGKLGAAVAATSEPGRRCDARGATSRRRHTRSCRGAPRAPPPAAPRLLTRHPPSDGNARRPVNTPPHTMPLVRARAQHAHTGEARRARA